jgi:hypothetical protein
MVERTVASDLGFSGNPRPRTEFIASDWRERKSGTLQGFFSLLVPGGIEIIGCGLHRHADGKPWVALPGAPQIDAEGRVKLNLRGKKAYTPTVAIPDKKRYAQFQIKALAAIDKLLGAA